MEDKTLRPRELGTAMPSKKLITEKLQVSGRPVLLLPVSVEPPVLSCNLLLSLLNGLGFFLSFGGPACHRQAREQSTSSVAETRSLHTDKRFRGARCREKSVPRYGAYPFVQQCFVFRQSKHTHGALSLVVAVASGNTALARHHGVNRAASQYSSGHRTRSAEKRGPRYNRALGTPTM